MSRRYRGLALILLVLHPMAVQAGACKLLSKRCVDGPSTKQIGDYAVNRDCWQWEKQYECESAATDNACARSLSDLSLHQLQIIEEEPPSSARPAYAGVLHNE